MHPEYFQPDSLPMAPPHVPPQHNRPPHTEPNSGLLEDLLNQSQDNFLNDNTGNNDFINQNEEF